MKLMAMVLTSSHVCYAKRAVESIINQRPVSFDYDIFVNVNSIRPEYYQEVMEAMKKYTGVTVIQTESNGFPGLGHNSCLKIFKQHPIYDYLVFIDGDDLFFPVAFQQYEKLLVHNKDTDIVHLMLNDNITTRVKDHQNIKLHGNFYLYTAASAQANWWHKLEIQNPYKLPLSKCRTPSRILLCSRRVFNTPIEVRYSEECKLYDDYQAFLTVVENQKQGHLNTIAISDPNIYCYNAENDEGATLNFTPRLHSNEQEVFNQQCNQYTALQEEWEYLKKLPYYNIPSPSNFSLEERVVFCNKEFVQFEVQDRVRHAQEKLRIGDLKTAKKYFIRAIDGGAQSPSIDLNLGVCQYRTGELDKAINNFHKILLSEENFEPNHHLALIYFQLKEYKKACHHAIRGLKIRNEDVKLREIVNGCRGKINTIPIRPITKRQNTLDTKPIMCFYTGYSDPFNGKNYQERSVYGSEIAVVNIAEQMAERYNVFVFSPCKIEEEIVHNGVNYMNMHKFASFHQQVHINIMIVSRFTHFFYMYRINADKLYLWVHDARAHDYYQGKQFGTLGKHFFNNIAPMLTGIICVSEWHQGYFKQWSGISERYYHKIHVIGNSIDLSYFPKNVVKTKNKFVFCSDPSRGLDVLLKCFPKIQEKNPDATLDIYFSKLDDNLMKLVNSMNGVVFKGKVPEKKLCEELCKADVFFYPNRSHETYGIVAQEALAAKCVVVARRYSGIITTVGAGGKLISGNVDTPEFQEKAIGYINAVLADHEYKKRVQEVAGKYGIRNTWNTRAQEWFKLLNYL